MPGKDPTESKKSKDITQTLIQDVSFGVILSARKGKFLFLNAAFTSLTGYSADDLPEWDVWIIKAFPDDEWRQRAQAAWERALQGKESGGEMFKVLCRDGAVRHLHLEHTALDNGRTLLILTNRTEEGKIPDRGNAGGVTRTGGARSTGKETILLVDDEEAILEVNGEALKMLGYKVLTARGGTEAMKVYASRQSEIDLVILDLVMPDQDGRETFERLRALHPQVCVILASGYSANGIVGDIMSRGCKAFIQKPFDIQKLSLTVRSVLDGRTRG